MAYPYDEEDDDNLTIDRRPTPTGNVIAQANLQAAPDLAPAPAQQVQAFAQAAPLQPVQEQYAQPDTSQSVQPGQVDPFARRAMPTPEVLHQRQRNDRDEAAVQQRDQIQAARQQRQDQSAEDRRQRELIRGLKDSGVEIDTDPASGVQRPKVDEQGRTLYKPTVIDPFHEDETGIYSIKRDRFGNDQKVPLQPKIDPATGEKFVTSEDGVTKKSLGVDEDWVARRDMTEAGKVAGFAKSQLSDLKSKQKDLAKRREDLDAEAFSLSDKKDPTTDDRIKLEKVREDRKRLMAQLEPLQAQHDALLPQVDAAEAEYNTKKSVVVERARQEYVRRNPNSILAQPSAQAAAVEKNPAVAAPEVPAQDRTTVGDGSDFLRGAKVSLLQLKPLAQGTIALLGATAEKAFGSGGASTAVKEWGLSGYKDGMEKADAVAHENDDVTKAWAKAKQGDVGALVDWAQYAAGYLVGQAGESAAVSALSGLVGAAAGAETGPGAALTGAAGAATGLVAKSAVKSGIKGAVEKLIASTAGRMAEKQLAETGVKAGAAEVAELAATAALRKQAAASIAQGAALTANGLVQEAGSIFPEAVQKAKEEGRELTGTDLAKVWVTSVGAGAVEGLTDKLGLDTALGRMKFGGAGRIASGLRSGAVLAGAEGATEFAQTVLERMGAGQSLTDQEAKSDYINSALMGAFGGATLGGASGALHTGPSANDKDFVKSWNEEHAKTEGFAPLPPQMAPLAKAAAQVAVTGDIRQRSDEALQRVTSASADLEEATAAGDEPAIQAAQATLAAANQDQTVVTGELKERGQTLVSAVSEAQRAKGGDRIKAHAVIKAAAGQELSRQEAAALLSTKDAAGQPIATSAPAGAAGGTPRFVLSETAGDSLRPSLPQVAALIDMGRPTTVREGEIEPSTESNTSSESAPKDQQGNNASTQPATPPAPTQDLIAERDKLQQAVQRTPQSQADFAMLQAERGRLRQVESELAQTLPTGEQTPSASSPTPTDPAASSTSSTGENPAVNDRDTAPAPAATTLSGEVGASDVSAQSQSGNLPRQEASMQRAGEGGNEVTEESGLPRKQPEVAPEARQHSAVAGQNTADPETRSAAPAPASPSDLPTPSTPQSQRPPSPTEGVERSSSAPTTQQAETNQAPSETRIVPDSEAARRSSRLRPLKVTAEQVAEARSYIEGQASANVLRKLVATGVFKILPAKAARRGGAFITDANTGAVTVHLGELANALQAIAPEGREQYVADSLDHELRHHVTLKALTKEEIEQTGANLTPEERTALEQIYGARFANDFVAGAEAIAVFGQARTGRNQEAFNLFTEKARTNKGFADLIRKWLDYAKELANGLTGQMSARLRESIARVEEALAAIDAAPSAEATTRQAEPSASDQPGTPAPVAPAAPSTPDVVSTTDEPASPEQPPKSTKTEQGAASPTATVSGISEQANRALDDAAKPEPKMRFVVNDGGFSDNPIASTIMEAGGLMSKSTARQKMGERFANIAGEYDDAPKLANPTHNRIYRPNGMTPDDATQVLIEAGLLPEGATPPDMWRELERASKSAETVRQQQGAATRQQAEAVKMGKAFDREANTKNRGEKEVTFLDVNPGDTVKVGTETMKVVSVNAAEGSFVLEDGHKYGVQEVEGYIYGKLVREKPAKAEAPKFTIPQLRPKENQGDLLQGSDAPFNLAGEQATDGDSVTRERQQKEQDAAEAKAIADRDQTSFLAAHPEIPEGTPIFHAGNATVTGPVLIQLAASQPIQAYHGTPHKVDRFSLEKIGTGEGNQVYGRGLYFAQAQEVAEDYRQTLAQTKEIITVDGKEIKEGGLDYSAAYLVANWKSVDRALVGQTNKQLIREIKALQGKEVKAEKIKSGSVYTVALDVDQDELLDWDKPLSQQGKAVEAFKRVLRKDGWDALLDAAEKYDAGDKRAMKDAGYNIFDYPGSLGGLFHTVSNDIGPKKMARLMKQAGISGIQYLDQGSRVDGANKYNVKWADDGKQAEIIERSTGESKGVFHSFSEADKWVADNADQQSRNFVIFDEGKIKITHENGQPVSMQEATQLAASQPDQSNGQETNDGRGSVPTVQTERIGTQGQPISSDTRGGDGAIPPQRMRVQPEPLQGESVAGGSKDGEGSQSQPQADSLPTGKREEQVGQSNSTAAVAKNIADARMMAKDDAGAIIFLRQMAARADKAEKPEAAANYRAAADQIANQGLAAAEPNSPATESNRLSDAVTEALRKLPPAERKVLNMKLKNKSMSDIQKETGMNEKGVANAYAIALAKLKVARDEASGISPTIAKALSPDAQKTAARAQDYSRLSSEPQPEGKKYAGNLNLERIETTDEATRAVWSAVDLQAEDVRKQKRGVISHAETEAAAQELGITLKQLKETNPGSTANAEHLLAVRQIELAKSEQFSDAQKKWKTTGNADDFATMVQAMKEFELVHATMSGLRAEAGRALSSFNIIAKAKREADPALDLIDKLKKILGGEEIGDERLRQLAAMPDDPLARAKWLRDQMQFTLAEKLRSYWLANVLSGVPTQARNFLSNGIFAASIAPVRYLEAGIDAALAPLTRRERRHFLTEANAANAAYLGGLPEGLRNAWYIMKNGLSSAEAAKLEIPRHYEFQGIMKPWNIPGRLLLAADSIFKTMSMKSEIAAGASRTALQEGLRGPAYKARFEELVANPTPQIMEKAQEFADYMTFQGKPDEILQVAYKLRNSIQIPKGVPLIGGLQPLHYMIPFVQVPYNVAKTSLQFSPLGALGLLSPETRTKLGAETIMAKALLGSAILAGAAGLAAAGGLTGAAPEDPAEKDAFFRSGKKPYSMKIGDRWVSYRFWGPLAFPFVSAAAFHDATTKRGDAPNVERIMEAAAAIGQSIVDQTYFQGLSAALDAVRKPEQFAKNVLASTLSGFVPFSSLQRNFEYAFDDTLRNPEHWYQNIYAGVPLMGETLPPRLTAIGEPAKRLGQEGILAFGPAPLSKDNTDPTEKELERLEVFPSFTGTILHIGKAKVKLTEEEQQQYQRLTGRAIYGAAQTTIASPEYRSATDEERIKLLKKAIDHTRDRSTEHMRGRVLERVGA